MVDVGSISAALSSVKTAADIAKLIRDSDATLEKAELKLKLADLISALADARTQIAETKGLLIDKDDQIKGLNEQLEVKGKVVWESPYYWLVAGNDKDGPFCQRCYDKDISLVRLQGSGNGYWECKACKSDYRDKTYDASPMVFYSNSSFRDF
ncbi:MAG: hypothetical protein ACREPV_01720 [Lysobacter sp.]